MTRRCSVMRMPLAAHRASMSFDLTAVTAPSSVELPYSTDGLTSPVAARAPPCCDPVGLDNTLRGGRRCGNRREHRAVVPACCPRRLPETPCACRYRPSAADANQEDGAKALVRGGRARPR